MTAQIHRVWKALRDADDGVCSQWFVYGITPGIPRVAARVSELRNEGHAIVTETCDLENFHPWRVHDRKLNPHVKYRLEWVN